MKWRLIIIGIFWSNISTGQITFSNILQLEKKTYKEAQAFLLKDYSIIEYDKYYYYFPLTKCNNDVKIIADTCKWGCISPDHLNGVESKYPLDKVVFKSASNENYESWLIQKSTFAENYKPDTKKATTFIKLKEKKTWHNANCKNEFHETTNIGFEISIQFANLHDWNEFKSAVSNNASFQETWRMSETEPIEFRYGIRRYKFNNSWKGVFINLYEDYPTYHASITFDSWGVE